MGKSKKSGKKKRRRAERSQKGAAPAAESVAAAETVVEQAPAAPPVAEEVVAAYYDTPSSAPSEKVAESLPETSADQTVVVAAPEPAASAPSKIEAADTPVRGAALWRRIGAASYDLLFLIVFSGLIVGFTIGWMFLSFAEPLDPTGVGFNPAQAKSYLLKAVLVCAASAYLYSVLMETWWLGATLGKLIFNLRVVDPEAKPISFGRANLRFVSKFATVLTLGVGMFSGLFKRNRQTLHDRLSKTLVVLRAS